MLFYFTVSFFPDDADIYKPHVDHNGSITEHGIVAGDSYGAAVNKVVEFVGKDNVIEVGVYELDDPISMNEVQDLDKF